MKTTKRILVGFVAIFVLTIVCITATAWDNGPGVEDVTIESITVFDNGDFYLYFDKDISGNGSGIQYAAVFQNEPSGGSTGSVPQTEEGRKQLLTIATAAFLAGKKVKVYANASSTTSWAYLLGALKMTN